MYSKRDFKTCEITLLDTFFLLFKRKPLAPCHYDVVVCDRLQVLVCEPEGLAVIDRVTHLILVTREHIAGIETLDCIGNIH